MGQALPAAGKGGLSGAVAPPWQCGGLQHCIDLGDACGQDDVITDRGVSSALDEVWYPLPHACFAGVPSAALGPLAADDACPADQQADAGSPSTPPRGPSALGGAELGLLGLSEVAESDGSPQQPGSPACWEEVAFPDCGSPAPALPPTAEPPAATAERCSAAAAPAAVFAATASAPPGAAEPPRPPAGGASTGADAQPAPAVPAPAAFGGSAAACAAAACATAAPLAAPAEGAPAPAAAERAEAAAAPAERAAPQSRVRGQSAEAPARGRGAASGGAAPGGGAAAGASRRAGAQGSPAHSGSGSPDGRRGAGAASRACAGERRRADRFVLEAVHPRWKGHLTLQQDGSFHRAGGILAAGDAGRWTISGGTLYLVWDRWDPEELQIADGGRTFESTSGFRLTTPPAKVPPEWLLAEPPPAGDGDAQSQAPGGGRDEQAAQDGGAGARWGDAAAGAADDGWRGGGAGGAAGAGDAMAVAEQLSIVRSDGATSNNRGADEDEDLFAAARGMKLFHISDVDVRPPPHTMDRSGMAPLPGWNGNVGRQRVER